MGGRGASSGISKKGKPYGTEFKAFLQVDNIKYVKKIEGATTAPLETMSNGRVYATYNKNNKLKSITLYDENNIKLVEIHPNIHGNKKLKFGHVHYTVDHGKEKPLPKKYRKLLHKVIREKRKYDAGFKR